MTLPSRRKHPITARITRRLTAIKGIRFDRVISETRRLLRARLRQAALAAWLVVGPASLTSAQTGWQPTRVPASSPRPISSAVAAPQESSQALRAQLRNMDAPAAQPGSASPRELFSNAAAAASASSQPPAVVLRWKTRQPTPAVALHRQATPAPTSQLSAAEAQQAFDGKAHQAFQQSRPDSMVGYTPAEALPPAQPIRQVNYQQEVPPPPFGADLQSPESGQVPAFPPPEGQTLPQQPAFDGVPGQNEGLSPFDAFDDAAPNQPTSPDVMQAPEPAPTPDSLLQDQSARPNPFRQDEPPSLSPSDEPSTPPARDDNADRFDQGFELPDRDVDFSSASCNEVRSRVKNRPLTDLSLDVSPPYGRRGLRPEDASEAEQNRLDFAATAPVRSWRDVTNRVVAVGRLIDLRDDQVVLDVDGQHRTIPVLDLSDSDIAYLGDAWNIPIKCGVGNESFDGRQFIASTVHWTAPGNCHKPLYFQQPQLERYGHEIGPVLQPIVSTAHFFGNIVVLPYKMGIHPPNECQYALGYYRPGNCAPYMVPPVPISLRGAAVQAAAVTGAAALIP